MDELVACTSLDWSDAPAGASTRLALHAWGDGSRPLTTWDEHVDAYVALRILALDDARTRVVFPHPSPQQAWHRAGIDPEELRHARQTATVRYAALAEDVMGLLDWQADGRLDVTLHRLAIRLACSVTALEGALASLESGRMATVVRSDEAVGRHGAVVVKTPY
ncbi:hypothetical protein AB6N23_01355 [Cellulomonas sp. 179-A 9B4 NHS]|uniref:hypothetical protein n=1 Tax=Cellulomonas sp. 179-A 9B4 NHS TaxID=3142379 RepID=UPI0039A18FEC